MNLRTISKWFESELIPFMGSRLMIFIFTIIILIQMVKHTKDMYMANVTHTKQYLGLLYAIILDGATLISVLRATLSKNGIAWWSVGYAVVGFLVNIFYLFENIPHFYPKITIALMLPLTIAYFSHEIAPKKRSNLTLIGKEK